MTRVDSDDVFDVYWMWWEEIEVWPCVPFDGDIHHPAHPPTDNHHLTLPTTSFR